MREIALACSPEVIARIDTITSMPQCRGHRRRVSISMLAVTLEHMNFKDLVSTLLSLRSLHRMCYSQYQAWARDAQGVALQCQLSPGCCRLTRQKQQLAEIALDVIVVT